MEVLNKRNKKLLAFALGMSLGIIVDMEILISSSVWIIMIFPIFFIAPIIFTMIFLKLSKKAFFPEPKIKVTILAIPLLLLISVLAPYRIHEIVNTQKIPVLPGVSNIIKRADVIHGDNPLTAFVCFTTRESVDNIFKFYNSKFIMNGWKLNKKFSKAEGYYFLQWIRLGDYREGFQIVVYIAKLEDGNRVEITLM